LVALGTLALAVRRALLGALLRVCLLRTDGLLGRALCQLTHRPAQGVQFTVVLQLLALGYFQGLEQFVQVVQHLLQDVGDAVNILNRPGDGR